MHRLAGLGLQLYQMFSKSSSAKALDKANAKNVKLQTQNIVNNISQQANANNTKYNQEIEAMQENAMQVYLENLQGKATAQTSAAGSGISGNSIENIFKGYDRATAVNNFISERNIRNMRYLNFSLIHEIAGYNRNLKFLTNRERNQEFIYELYFFNAQKAG